MERRSFVSTLFATVAGVFAWLIGGTAEAHKPPLPVPSRRPRFIKTIGIGRNTVTCHDQATLDSWTEIQRQVEACRIKRETGLSAIRHIGNDRWYAADPRNLWYAVQFDEAMERFEAGDERLDGFYFDDPADCLIAAEPQFIAWKSEQEAKAKD